MAGYKKIIPRMKKTLLITLEFPPSHGGIATYYKHLCDHLPSTSIVVLRHTDVPSNIDILLPYKVYSQKLISNNPMVWPRWARAIKLVRDVVKKENIEVIVVGQILPLGTVAYCLKRLFNIPYYVFCHGMDIAGLSGRKKIVAKNIIHQAHGIFCNSNFTKHCVEKFQYPFNHIFTIYPCPQLFLSVSDTDIMKFKNTYHLHNRKILLSVGRLVPRKGFDKVIEALAGVSRKINNVCYVIVGEGDDKERLEHLVVKYNLQSYVVFTGGINSLELSAAYEACDAFIMPCRELPGGDVEGFGIVFLEANLFGKPVIAGRSGGVSEAVIPEVTGILVDPLNVSDITDAVLHLLTRPDIAHKLGIQGMDRVHSQFQWHTQADRFEHQIV